MPKKALNRSYVPESYDSHFPRHDAYMYWDYADEKKKKKSKVENPRRPFGYAEEGIRQVA